MTERGIGFEPVVIDAAVDAQDPAENPDWSFLPGMSFIAGDKELTAFAPEPRSVDRKETVLEMLSRTRPHYVHKPPETKPWHPQDERVAAEKRQTELRRQREQYEAKRPIVTPSGYREVEDFPGIKTFISERTGRRYTVYDVRRGTLDPTIPAEDFPTATVQGAGLLGVVRSFAEAILRLVCKLVLRKQRTSHHRTAADEDAAATARGSVRCVH